MKQTTLFFDHRRLFYSGKRRLLNERDESLNEDFTRASNHHFLRTNVLLKMLRPMTSAVLMHAWATKLGGSHLMATADQELTENTHPRGRFFVPLVSSLESVALVQNIFLVSQIQSS